MSRKALAKKKPEFEKYLKWFSSLTYEKGTEITDKVGAQIQLHHDSNNEVIKKALTRTFSLESWCTYPPSESPEFKWPKQRKQRMKEYQNFFDMADTYEIPIHVGAWHEGEYAFLYLGNQESGIIVLRPERVLEYIQPEEYETKTIAQIRKELSGTETASAGEVSMIPAGEQNTLTKKAVSDEIEATSKQIASLDEEILRVKNAETGELAEMKEKIRALQETLDAKIAKARDALELEKKKAMAAKKILERKIYALSSQIYAIECYSGEVVKFVQLRSGTPASEDEPLVIHQKLRFLDEELGKLTALYTIDWEDIDLFEEFLKHSPLALETFAPSQKSAMLVRLSRNGKILKANGMGFDNLLETHEYYHGSTIGIIIRNGDNLYLGWTDEEMIHIQDDLIISQVITTQEPAPEFLREEDEEQWLKAQEKERDRIIDGIVSRSFIYNILQGLADHSNILGLPAGTTLNKESKYVVYAVADKWLADNRFGNFDKIVERCNERVHRGDYILTVQRLIPEHSRSFGSYSWPALNRPYENSRGRGEANRTHDCVAQDRTIYRINLVEYDDPIAMIRYRVPTGTDPEKWSVRTTQAYYWPDVLEMNPDAQIMERYEYRKKHVFISLKKSDAWRYDSLTGKTPRANFELFSNEYINLTYMNSVWLKAIITSKNLGNWRIGGREVNYNYAIQYLNTALDYVLKREKIEKEMIDKMNRKVCEDSEWPVKLSEWKLANDVRIISPYQVKRFVKAMFNK